METELRTVPEEDSRSMRTAPEGPVVAPEGEVATAFYRANEHQVRTSKEKGTCEWTHGEGDGAPVGEGNERVALLVILNDPLSVLFAKSRGGGKRLGNGNTGGHVLDDCRARLGGLGSDGELDLVTSLDGDAGEVVGVVGVPLVPSWIEQGRLGGIQEQRRE